MINALLFVHENHTNCYSDEEEENSDDNSDDGADVGLILVINFGLLDSPQALKYSYGYLFVPSFKKYELNQFRS